MERSTKIALSIGLVLVYLFLLYSGLGLLLFLIASWVMTILIVVVQAGICYTAYKSINWIWKVKENGELPDVSLQPKKDDSYRRVFLIIWLLLMFSVIFLEVWLVIAAYFNLWLLFVALIGMCYSLYKFVKWIWLTEQLVIVD